ncbi:MAG: hypothetical protein OEO79_16265 [Gemmatimonadota bacterium]|nr:hypothetical protein [Gemmatimonadota bacterium]
MPRIEFAELPDHGRLWVFPIDRPLTSAEADRCLAVVDAFLARWAAHGAPLRSGRELRHGRFLLIGVDEDAESPSGCSIDALVNQLRALGDEMGATFIEHSPVWYRAGEGIVSVSRSEFKVLAGEEKVTPDTVVFDTSLTRLSELRAGRLEHAVRDGWHGRAFFRLAPKS